MKTHLIIVLSLLVLLGCQTKPDQEIKPGSKESGPAKDTMEQIPAITTGQPADSAWGSYIAVLKNGIDQVEATLNGRSAFVVKKGQLFLYETNSHSAWIANGRCAYISPDQVQKADAPYFKFTFGAWNFYKTSKHELAIAAKKVNIDYNPLIKKIQDKDPGAFRQFFDLRKQVEGPAAAEYPFELWALLNLWKDKELSSFIKILPPADQKEFCQLIMNITPFAKAEEYFKLYYPVTFREFLAINIAG